MTAFLDFVAEEEGDLGGIFDLSVVVLGVMVPTCLDFDAEEEGVFRTLTIRFVENRDGGVVAPLLDKGVVDFVDLAVLG